MRAVTYREYGGPERLSLVDLPVPEPKRAEVRVKVLACGINLSDWENLTGSPLYARLGGLFRPRRPVLGSDIVGEIVALGEGVTGWAVGDRVWAEVVMRGGGFAQECTLPVNRLARVPEDLDNVTAAALPQPGSIALAGTKGVKAGQKVLINGAGGASGPLAIQLAKAAGADVTGVDHAGKAAFMQARGADRVIDYRSTDFANEDVHYDLILDLAGTRPMRRIAPALAPGGRYRLIGGTMRALFSALFVGFARGVMSGKKIGVGAAEGDPATLDRIGALAMEGKLTPEIAGTLGLDGVPEALAQVGAGAAAGKLVVLPNG